MSSIPSVIPVPYLPGSIAASPHIIVWKAVTLGCLPTSGNLTPRPIKQT